MAANKNTPPIAQRSHEQSLSRNGSDIAKLGAFAIITTRACAMERVKMYINWAHAAPTVLAAFFASLVEFVEALTVVLAVGAVAVGAAQLVDQRLRSSSSCCWSLCSGRRSLRIPEADVQLVLGTLLLLFGMRWLRKAVLRASGGVQGEVGTK
jgi:hypothetical protein